MLYDLSNKFQREQFLHRAAYLADKATREGSGVAELTEKRQRSLQQNRYLHVIIAYWGIQQGYTLAEAKQVYKDVNAEAFWTERDVPGYGRMRWCRSTRDLTVEETGRCIERWRAWVSQNYGWYIPTPDEHRLVEQMEVEVSRHSHYL